MEAAVGRHSRLSSQWLSIEDGQGVHAVPREGGADPARGGSSAPRGEDADQDLDDADSRRQELGPPPQGPLTTLESRKKEFRILVFILAPAMVTTFVLLGMYWNEESDCSSPLKAWCMVEAFRLAASMTLSWVLQRDVEYPPERIAALDQVGRVMSMFSFCWFVLGHIWLVADAGTCSQQAPHLFHLTAALIILQYTLMLLPVIVLVLLAPFVCLCLPCIIQGFLLFNKSDVKGATKRQINRLPTEKYSPREFANKGYDEQCSICIADFEPSEVVRVLRCRHVFHKDCVDSWLTLNGTCPICRAEISQKPAPERSRPHADAASSSEAASRRASEAAGVLARDVEAGNGDNVAAPTAAAAAAAAEAQPTAGERVAASSVLWSRMFTLRSIFARRRRRRELPPGRGDASRAEMAGPEDSASSQRGDAEGISMREVALH